ncbi:unnamed protein product [Prunus armeniaca]
MAYSSQQNRVAERKNRTIEEMAKCMMFEKKMPLEFWAKAVNTIVYVLNWCPTKALDKKTPFEAYSGRKPGIKHLRVFGSLCYAHVPNQQRQKLDLASTRCVVLRYGSCEKGYRLYNTAFGRVVISKDVETGEASLTQAEIPKEEHVEIGPGPQEIDHTPLRYKSIVEIYERCNLCIIEPETFEEAVKDESWQKAMENEIAMIEKNNTWELVNRPADKPVIDVKWVYKTKLNLDGSVQENKARLVAKGYSQKPGIDFNETFAPVQDIECFGCTERMEVVSARCENKEDRVYKLKKALYGLKQAPRAWYEEINSYFTKGGFQRSPSETTLYVKIVDSGILIVSLYVDDIIYTRSSRELMMEFKTEMMKQYEMTDLGLLHHFLGLDVIQTESCIFPHQKKYARTLLDKFGFKDCKSVATPLAVNEKLSKVDGSEQANESVYR